MSFTTRLAAAGLIALTLAACSTAPAAVEDPVPPPQRSYDAKTQLEYGERAPPSRPRY